MRVPVGGSSRNGRYRRVLPVVGRPTEGLLTEPTADARDCRSGLVKMILNCMKSVRTLGRLSNIAGCAKPSLTKLRTILGNGGTLDNALALPLPRRTRRWATRRRRMPLRPTGWAGERAIPRGMNFG